MPRPTYQSPVGRRFANPGAFTLFSLVGTSFRCAGRLDPVHHSGSVSEELDRQLAMLADPAAERQRAACERRPRSRYR